MAATADTVVTTKSAMQIAAKPGNMTKSCMTCMSMTFHPWLVEGSLIGVIRKRVNELTPGSTF